MDFQLASLTLQSDIFVDDACGSNGLPVTPNSIRIIGNFKAHVESVRHKNLVNYIDCFRNKNEKVTIIFEHYERNDHHRGIGSRLVAKQILDAIHELHEVIDTVHGLIDNNSIVWSDSSRLKLTHWAINKLTDGGTTLESDCLVPSDKRFLAPEQIGHQSAPDKLSTKASDIWSCALLLATQVWPSILSGNMPDNISSKLALCETPEQVLELLDLKSRIMLRSSTSPEPNPENNEEGQQTTDIAPSEWLKFFTRTLEPKPELRANITELYKILGLLQEYHGVMDDVPVWKDEEVERLDMRDLYHLWRLSWGRNFFESENLQIGVRSAKDQTVLPSIFSVPCIILAERPLSSSSDQKRKTHLVIETKVKSLSIDKLKNNLDKIDKSKFYPLILTPSSSGASPSGEQFNVMEYNEKISQTDSDAISQTNTSQSLPLIIREADFSYQCERMVLFKRLLTGCPYLKNELAREAQIDIPPCYRAQTWAVLLDLRPSDLAVYDRIDKTTPSSTDRQISVDIPRCHQYNELMASPQGHLKLSRILKAWLNYNKSEYVYWQGLDSLAAPFLLLNFADESMAFACFHSFVQKYLRGFFQKDNQLVVQRYLDLFFDLLSHHDSALADHLDRLGFAPNLYAIPWFLTMFTHVLPLHKILHVWDRLLLGNETFPLCIGLAILAQFRDELLNYTFNDCIVVFSDLPEIDIERCINDACHFYNTTPEKLMSRGPLLSDCLVGSVESEIH